MAEKIYGTIGWLVKYEKDGEIDYRSFQITGSDEESIKNSLVASIVSRKWKIVSIEEITNTFKYGGK